MRTYEDIHIMVLRNDVEGLVKASKDVDETIREEAVKVLRVLNPPEAAEVLKQALSDPSPKVRRAALGNGKMRPGFQERVQEQNRSVSADDSAKLANKRDSQRWLWILLGTWGIGSLLLAFLILIFMFSDGNFGHTGQIIGILVSGFFGVVMLWVAVKKLRSTKGD